MNYDHQHTRDEDPEATLVSGLKAELNPPLFDRESVAHARAAVPLGASRNARRWPAPWLLLSVAAGVLGGFVAVGALLLYQHREPQPAPAVVSGGTPGATQDSAAATPAPAAQQTEAAPARTPQDGSQTAAADGSSPRAVQKVDGTPADAAPGSPAEQAELRRAFAEWLAATNARDIDRQMQFYGATVPAYYRARNASRAEVRAEKARAFGRAQRVEVRAGEPEITFAPDGRSATMRFRKRYEIDGRAGARRGEVLQELRWVKAADGWKIIGERDVRVLG